MCTLADYLFDFLQLLIKPYDIVSEMPSKSKQSVQSSPTSPQAPELPPFPTDSEGTTSHEVGNQASPMIKFGQDVRIV